MNGVFVNIKSDTSPLRAFITMLDETLKNQNKKLDVDNLDFELIRCVKKSKDDEFNFVYTIYPSDEFICYVSSIIELNKQDE